MVSVRSGAIPYPSGTLRERDSFASRDLGGGGDRARSWGILLLTLGVGALME
ncbi:hypothetical protein QUB10_00020 [Microcoleus sp. B5-D4]|uniref:hypothetical protein n=1 Tax=unclassified Microcoleus TaxID=2642155 RepID=UPI002FD25550